MDQAPTPLQSWQGTWGRLDGDAGTGVQQGKQADRQMDTSQENTQRAEMLEVVVVAASPCLLTTLPLPAPGAAELALPSRGTATSAAGDSVAPHTVHHTPHTVQSRMRHML